MTDRVGERWRDAGGAAAALVFAASKRVASAGRRELGEGALGGVGVAICGERDLATSHQNGRHLGRAGLGIACGQSGSERLPDCATCFADDRRPNPRSERRVFALCATE